MARRAGAQQQAGQAGRGAKRQRRQKKRKGMLSRLLEGEAAAWSGWSSAFARGCSALPGPWLPS